MLDRRTDPDGRTKSGRNPKFLPILQDFIPSQGLTEFFQGLLKTSQGLIEAIQA